MENPAYPRELLRQDMQFVKKKFGLNQTQFDAIISAPLVEAKQYPSHYFLFHKLQRHKNAFRRIATAAR